MTHPIYHNRSVAAFLSISRDAEANSLAIHQWLDATRELFADARSRSPKKPNSHNTLITPDNVAVNEN